MVSSCSAYGCKQRYKKGSGITFHKLPKEPLKKLAWMMALRRKDWIPSEYSVICGKHFEDRCFYKEGNRLLLLPDAVPTIFSTHTANYKYYKKLIGKTWNDCPNNDGLNKRNFRIGRNNATLIKLKNPMKKGRKKCFSHDTNTSIELDENAEIIPNEETGENVQEYANEDENVEAYLNEQENEISNNVLETQNLNCY